MATYQNIIVGAGPYGLSRHRRPAEHLDVRSQRSAGATVSLGRARPAPAFREIEEGEAADVDLVARWRRSRDRSPSASRDDLTAPRINLHFVGISSLQSFGSVMRFIYGAKHAAAILTARAPRPARAADIRAGATPAGRHPAPIRGSSRTRRRRGPADSASPTGNASGLRAAGIAFDMDHGMARGKE